jgi:hypothetical protein
MKLNDLKKQAQQRPNLVAKNSRMAGNAGTHKTDKDYHRQEKHKKDLRRFEEGSVPDKKITITMGIKGDAESKIAKLLHHISNHCAMGASRDWGIVDGDSDEKHLRVGFDGDGADKLIDVKVDGKPVKDYL